MTNQEYQQMANERSRQLDEARRRQSLADFNRQQQEQRARNEQASKDAYSASLGRRGIAPPPLGPGVNPVVYNRALQGYKASQQMAASFAPSSQASVYSAASSGASSRGGGSGSGAGKFFAFLIVAGGLLLLFAGNSSSSGPSTSSPSESASETQSPVADTAATSKFDLQPNLSTTAASSSSSTSDVPSAPVGTSQPPVASLPFAIESQPSGQPQSQDSQPLTDASGTGTAAPAHTIAQWPRAGLTFYASRKGAHNGCEDGQLTLGVAGLSFLCPGNDRKSVSVAVTQIRDVDDDGIVLYTNEKFHFKTPGTSKEQIHLQFQDWLSRVSARP